MEIVFDLEQVAARTALSSMRKILGDKQTFAFLRTTQKTMVDLDVNLSQIPKGKYEEVFLGRMRINMIQDPDVGPKAEDYPDKGIQEIVRRCYFILSYFGPGLSKMIPPSRN